MHRHGSGARPAGHTATRRPVPERPSPHRPYRRSATPDTIFVDEATKEVVAMVDLMSLEEGVDRDFTVARRRAWMRGVGRRLRGSAGTSKLLAFQETRRSVGAASGVRRDRSTVELSRIVGSDGKSDWFDEGFMPLRGLSRERWKRIDRAFRLGLELPPVSLYKLGDAYFVEDGHHRVSVACFHGAEWIDAEVTEFWSPKFKEASATDRSVPPRPWRCSHPGSWP